MRGITEDKVYVGVGTARQFSFYFGTNVLEKLGWTIETVLSISVTKDQLLIRPQTGGVKLTHNGNASYRTWKITKKRLAFTGQSFSAQPWKFSVEGNTLILHIPPAFQSLFSEPTEAKAKVKTKAKKPERQLEMFTPTPPAPTPVPMPAKPIIQAKGGTETFTESQMAFLMRSWTKTQELTK